MITNISLASVFVKDVDASKSFYIDVLGFEEHTDIKGSVELIEPAMKRRGSVAEAGSGGTI